MDCEEFRKLLPLGVESKLGWWRRRRFFQHLEACPWCQLEWNCTEGSPIARIADTIIEQAIRDAAREIHIEPSEGGVSVLNRHGDDLREMTPLPLYIEEPLSFRLKAMAGMDPRRRDTAQQGCLSFQHGGTDYRFAVATTPVGDRERIVMRLL